MITTRKTTSFPSMKVHDTSAKLARNYKILSFEFSKFAKDMKGKFDKVYL